MDKSFRKFTISIFVFFSITLGSATGAYAEAELMYDTDTNSWKIDTDGDTFPDLTEKLGGTDPMNAEDFPGADADTNVSKAKKNVAFGTRSVGFPTGSCRPGFIQVGPRLCITWAVQSATRYDVAMLRCRDKKARVATYGDLFYLYIRTNLDASFNPSGKWIGNMVADDRAFYGNRSITFNNDPDMWNFEGVANKGNNRAYWCAHDDES